MKNLTTLLIAASLALVGCGADSGTTAAQDAAFKKGDKTAIKPPPAGSNQRPANFHSSADDLPKGPGGAGGAQGAGAPASGTATTGG